MITPEQLARQIAVYSYITKTKNAGTIAQATALSPLQVTNAFFTGERLRLFTVKRDKNKTIDKIEVSDEQYDQIALTISNFGEAVESLVNSAYDFIVNRNSVERDVEEYSIIGLSRAPDVMVTVAIEVLKNLDYVHVYEYADPLDQESVYTFYTLPENKDKKWYKNDFKTTNGKKKK